MKRKHFLNYGVCRANSQAKRHSLLAGFAVLLIAAMFAIAGCDTGTNGGGFIPVTGITNVRAIALQGEGLPLSGTVEPANATNTTITWSGDNVTNGIFTASSTGDSTVTATVVNGASESSNYIKNFTITAYNGTASRIADAQGTWTKDGLTMVITNSNWVVTGLNDTSYGGTVTQSKGILVSVGALNYVSQVTGVYISEISQWYPWYSNETGAYDFTDTAGDDTLVLTASSGSYAEMTGIWIKNYQKKSILLISIFIKIFTHC
jgi:hypothetical protein